MEGSDTPIRFQRFKNSDGVIDTVMEESDGAEGKDEKKVCVFMYFAYMYIIIYFCTEISFATFISEKEGQS